MHTAVAVVVSFGIIQSIKLLTKVSGFCMLGKFVGDSVTSLLCLPTLELRWSRCQSARTPAFEFSTQPHHHRLPLACFCFVGGVTSEQDPAVLPSTPLQFFSRDQLAVCL